MRDTWASRKREKADRDTRVYSTYGSPVVASPAANIRRVDGHGLRHTPHTFATCSQRARQPRWKRWPQLVRPAATPSAYAKEQLDADDAKEGAAAAAGGGGGEEGGKKKKVPARKKPKKPKQPAAEDEDD